MVVREEFPALLVARREPSPLVTRQLTLWPNRFLDVLLLSAGRDGKYRSSSFPHRKVGVVWRLKFREVLPHGRRRLIISHPFPDHC